MYGLGLALRHALAHAGVDLSGHYDVSMMGNAVRRAVVSGFNRKCGFMGFGKEGLL